MNPFKQALKRSLGRLANDLFDAAYDSVQQYAVEKIAEVQAKRRAADVSPDTPWTDRGRVSRHPCPQCGGVRFVAPTGDSTDPNRVFAYWCGDMRCPKRYYYCSAQEAANREGVGGAPPP